MNIVNRVKNILITPKTEWDVIEKESSSLMSLFSTYILLLVAIPAVCSFIGMGFIGYKIWFVHVKGIDLGVKSAIITVVSIVGTYFAGTFLIDGLAPTFKGQKNTDQAARLSAYSLTAACIAGVFFLLPAMYALGMLGALYGGYIMYTGAQKTMKVPDDQLVVYTLVCALGMAVIYWLVAYILSIALISVNTGSVNLNSYF